MSRPSLVNAIIARPWLQKFMSPIASWYCNSAGYRQMGLRADDLIPEEDELVLKAISRLPPKEQYDRIFRMRRATQLSLSHQPLAKAEHTKPEEDLPYLSYVIKEIEAEEKERADLESLVITKPTH